MLWGPGGNKTGTGPPLHRAHLRARVPGWARGEEARQERAGVSADATEGQGTADERGSSFVGSFGA